MPIQALMRALVVPIFILLMTWLYWFSIQDASSSAQRVPWVVIVFILVMTLIVVIVDVLNILRESQQYTCRAAFRSNIVYWYRANYQSCFFVGLSLAYMFFFVYLGFNLANFLFLGMALPLSGLGKMRARAVQVILCLALALLASVIFHLLAQVMDFNVPISPFGI